MNDNQAICLKCGVKTGVGNAFCQNCGQAVAPEAEVCLNCGVATKTKSGDLAGQDKITIALVCFFLGGLGIHNFMMGENKKGVAKIVLSFCLGLGGLLALIEFFKILLDKYEVDPEKIF
jgi:hypothetical protein